MDLITAFKDEAAISESVTRYVTASHGADRVRPAVRTKDKRLNK